MTLRSRRLFMLLGGYTLLVAAACQTMQWRGSSAPIATAPAPMQPTIDQQKAAQAGFDHDVIPIMQKYCFDCHNSKDHVADLALDKFTTVDAMLAKRDIWEMVGKFVRTQQMPPDGNPQPTDAERKRMSGWVDGELYAYYAAHPDPGRVTLRRMNRSEYNNTIRDLVGVDFRPADDFPQDDSGFGFDNIGDVLTLPTMLMEKYLTAADNILEEALPTAPPASKIRHVPAAQTQIGFNAAGDRGDGWVKLITLEEDDAAIVTSLPPGEYIFRMKAFSEATGGGVTGGGNSVPLRYTGPVPTMRLALFVDDAVVQDFELDAKEDAPKIYETHMGLPGGKVRISAMARRNRGGDNETQVLNGRPGGQQAGIAYLRYMEIEGPLPMTSRRFAAKTLQTQGPGQINVDGAWVMKGNGEAGTTINVPKAGEYILRASASALECGTQHAQMEFRINGEPVKSFEVTAMATEQQQQRVRVEDAHLLRARPYIYEVHATLPAGQVHFSAALTNYAEDPAAQNPNLRARILVLDYLEVVNPDQAPPAPPMLPKMAQYFATGGAAVGQSGDDRSRARGALTEFMKHAFRRPVQAAEVDRLMGLYDMAAADGQSSDEALKVAMKGVLVSPYFLFVGADTRVAPPAPSKTAAAMQPISEYALASRLSYFLWSSTPDDELLDLASKNSLRKNLDAQINRMLASPKSDAFVQNFSGQWLGLRNLKNLAPDKTMFSDYDDAVRGDMQRETTLLFDSILRENRSAMEFLTADYTFLNARLAKFYGIDGVQGDDFRKVSLADTNRRGLLTQGSILTLTSNPTRTSPVKRGKFVLESLLGTPPPPPPPDVPKLEETKAAGGTLRHQMEVHRENPACASCHAQMDPIGFGLENFDAVGKWRDTDGTNPVDAKGVLKSGETFANARELSQILASTRREDFLHNLTEKTLTYALGRGVEPFDRPAVEDIVKGMEANDCRFDTLITGIAHSLPFQMQRTTQP